jgi:YegS/Rv2252/BmrU family lipid kinase
MKTRFIFNPCSGHNRRRPGLDASIRAFISSCSLDAEMVTTDAPGHATELAREAAQAGCGQVVAVGGDGTMNEVAQALLHTPAALALVPCGSGNGLALHLGLPLAPRAALTLIAGAGIAGRVAAIDTGTADGWPFFNAMGLGLDAEVSHRFNGLVQRGLPGYVRTALAAVRNLRPERVRLTGAACDEERDVLLVAVANSDQYGNHARIAPGARVDDGLLDLVAVAPVGLVGAAVLAGRLFTGTFDRSPRVRHLRGAAFVIERAAPGLLHTDGETHPAGARVEVRVQPRSLRVLVPLTSRAAAQPVDSAPAGFALHLP